MDKVFNVYKPLGVSSHDVVNVVRRLFNTKKVGHAGTLDVEASGVLIIGVGEGTKLLNHLQNHTKVYDFDIYFGKTTDTLDHTGTLTDVKKADLPEKLDVSSWIGPYLQTPPAYSAVKVAGKKLYEYARKDQTIPQVAPRELTLYAFTQTTPLAPQDDGFVGSFKVHGSTGLYVRQLAFDLAQSLNTVAHTTRIFRQQVGTFHIDHATPIDQLKAENGIMLADAIPDIKPYVPSAKELHDVKVGKHLNLTLDDAMIKVIDADKHLFGLYEKREQVYVPIRIFKGV
jgi:tRNA pseudouridine55 synthase